MFEGEGSHDFYRDRICCGSHVYDTLEDALGCGLDYHRRGDLPAAAEVYDCILAAFPGCAEAGFYRALIHTSLAEHELAIGLYRQVMAAGPFPPALFYQMGMSWAGLGSLEQAADCFRDALREDPDHFEAWYNLGVVRQKAGEMEEAAAAYQRGLALCPDDFDLLFNLALVMRRLDRLKDAEELINRALSIEPDDCEAHYNLGLVYRDMGELAEAISSFGRSLEINPDFAVAINNLGILLVEIGAREQALKCFKRCIELDHRVPSARHMVAALTGETTPGPPREYVRSLFDHFSPAVEASLVKNLDYRTPSMLRSIFDRHADPRRPVENTLDLGCGTGLCGEVFRDLTRFLSGVDLSARMVEAAETKGCYDELQVDDLLDYLKSSPRRFDLLVAADVLVYLGELQPLFQEAAPRLIEGGYFLFSTELSEEEGVKLRQTGRYAHSTAYIKTCLERNGFSLVHCAPADIRRERGEWLKGCLHLVRKG
jgi:predicted TPR repeat methyltransferase